MTALTRRPEALLAVERARDMLAAARAVDEVKKIRDVAVAMRAYARTQAAGRTMALDAGEIIVRADARMGQLSREIAKAPRGGGDGKGPKRGTSPTKAGALADLGAKATGQRASEWERIASLPARDLDRYVEASRKAGQAPSTAGAVALARLAEPARAELCDKLCDKPDVAKAIQQANAEQRRGLRFDKLEKISRGNEPLLPPTIFPVVLADPPWRYEAGSTDPTRDIENQYPTMTIEEIAALVVPATDDAILFLWHPPGMATEAVRVASAWGFRERSSWVWVKPSIGPGYWGRLRHEMVMICTRGDFPAPAPSDRFDSVIEAPRSEHSAKPAEVMDRIERMFPTLPKLELFAREVRLGWHAWGNQSHIPRGAK